MIKKKSLFDFIFSCSHVYDKTLQQEFYYCDSHSTWHSLAQSAQVGSVSAIVLEEIDAVENDHDCYGTSDSGGSDTDNDDDGYVNADMDQTDYQMRIDPEVASDDGGGDNRGRDSIFEHYSDNFTAGSECTASHQDNSYGYSTGTYPDEGCSEFTMASPTGSLSSFTKELEHEVPVEKTKAVAKKPKVIKPLETPSQTAPAPPPKMVINEPSVIVVPLPTKPAKKARSKINFTPETNDNEDNVLNDEEEEAHRAKMLLRSRRQSRSGGGEIKMEVKKVEEGQKKKMAQVTQKITQKIQVNNLIRSMKMTEMEKYSKSPEHLAYLNRVGDETKREINASLQEQLMSETLQTLLITIESYRRDLGINHPVMENIEERINYIEDVLETQEFNRVTEARTFIQKIAEKARTSTMPAHNRNASQLSFFGGPWMTVDDHTQDGLSSFRKSYANTNTLMPSTFVMTTVCIVCALLSAVFVYNNPPS